MGVLGVNVAGSLLVGLAMGRGVAEEERLLVAVGFLGAFTTMSAFAFDTLALAQQGRYALAGLNAVLNPTLSLAAAAVGFALARAT